jgi:DNA-binding NarL/FixJ family response regulator
VARRPLHRHRPIRSGEGGRVDGLGVDEDVEPLRLLEAARPAELAEVITDAYGFTARERAITTLVARGLSTTEIAGRLHVSPYTVQDHLKAIFDKSGTSSRGQLVWRLFLDRDGP